MDKIAEFLPIITTILAAIFAVEIFRHYRVRKTKYLFWWTIGIINFGLGTLWESINLLYGWSLIDLKVWYVIVKLWYITGALLGGFTLAQGTVYLLLSKRFGDIFTVIWCIFLCVAITCVILTPITLPDDFSGKLTGEVFTWEWVRLFSPFINLYAFVFLFGGAVYSANKYFQQIDKEARFLGNIYISAGTLLPGIGGIYTRIGYVNVLFVTELIGLFLIYRGYRIIRTNQADPDF